MSRSCDYIHSVPNSDITRASVCPHTHTQHARTHANTHTRNTHTRKHTHTQTHTHTHTQTHTHTHTHTHTQCSSLNDIKYPDSTHIYSIKQHSSTKSNHTDAIHIPHTPKDKSQIGPLEYYLLTPPPSTYPWWSVLGQL